MTVVVAGGSGFIGTLLSQKLLALGDTVIVIDINAPRFTHERLYYIQCDITSQKLPFNVLEKTDAVVNLAGVPISKKWNSKSKEQIKTSRILATKHIVESMRTTTNRPTILINASAVGYYGERGNEELTEQSLCGEGFLASVVSDWEQEARTAEAFGTRVVCIRTAPVVGHGGMIIQLKRGARFGFTSYLSKRDFWQPWIHEDDIVNTYLFALQTSTLQGPVNAVAPELVTHRTFMKAFAHTAHRHILGTVPQSIGKLLFGEVLTEITKSQKVYPTRLLDKGFVFQYSHLEDAMKKALTVQNETN